VFGGVVVTPRVDGCSAAQNMYPSSPAPCCAFFTFTFGTGADGGLTVEVQVPPVQVEVLDALAARVTAAQR
jgi:hypothetical protein